MKKRNYLLQFATLIIIILVVMATGCKKDDINDQEPTPPDDTTNIVDGYMLTKHLVETQEPCIVNIMFQVSDMEGNGINNLLTENFEVHEDDQPVSPTESAMTIKKKDAISYSLKTVLMLDNSTSVGDNIVEIKNAAIELVNGIVLKQEIAIYVFSEEAVLIQDFTSDINTLTNAINDISLGFATTNLYGSVSTGVSKWNDFYSINGIEQGFMILITDASDTQGSSTLNAALNSIGSKKVYTVGLGAEQDQNAMEQLGTAGYFSLSDYSELSNKFTEIQNEMSTYANSFYWLNYMSPKRGDHNHSLKLFVQNNLNNSTNAYITGSFNSSGFYSVAQGISINEGITSLELMEGESFELHAQTYIGDNNPNYTWESESNTDLSILVDPSDNSLATISAGFLSGGQLLSLTINDIANDFTLILPVTITEGPSPLAEFTTSSSLFFSNHEIEFLDYSTNNPVTWYWDFGDGTTSNIKNPKHTYNFAGSYLVSLTASNNYGSDTESKTLIVENDPIFTFVDSRDNRTYKAVQIGNQKWMSENLAYLPYVSPPTEFSSIYVNGYNGTDPQEAMQTLNYSTYGALYSNSTADCPVGWHLPTDEEWTELISYVSNNGYNTQEGHALKSDTLWSNPGNNAFFFDALPAGYRSNGQYFVLPGSNCWFWSSTMTNLNGVYYIRKIETDVVKDDLPGGYGLPVRCIKDY